MFTRMAVISGTVIDLLILAYESGRLGELDA
jgi:hypothetical protein